MTFKKKMSSLLKNNVTLFIVITFGFILFKSYASYSNNLVNNFSFNPSASIKAEKNIVCEKELMVITFEGLGGTAPYIFTYTVNNGAEQTITSNNLGIAEFNFREIFAGTFTYKLTAVKDASSEVIQVDNQEVSILVNAIPQNKEGEEAFDFDKNNVCAGEIITFTPNVIDTGGLKYLWIYEDGVTSELESPSHSVQAFGCSTDDQIFRVTMEVTNINGCKNSWVRLVTVTPKPDLEFFDVDDGDFNNCDNASIANPEFTVNVGNSSKSPCVDSYDIDWGDGSPLETSITFPIAHTYLNLGIYDMKVKGNGENGCFNELSYQVINIVNPVGDFSSPENTSNVCLTDAELDFKISNWETNSSDTTYTLDFGDGSPIETYTQDEVQNNNTYSHTYERGSCTLLNGEYVATVSIENLCSKIEKTINKIIILEPSIAEFESPEIACINSDVEFINKSIIGENDDCNKAANFTWDFGDGSAPLNDNGSSASNNQIHRYATSGTYTVTLTTTTQCNTAVFTKNICIEEVNTPTFLVDNEAGCIPLNVVATNTTTENTVCSAASYEWEVTYGAGNCETTGSWSFANGTDKNSENPQFLFSNPGFYTLIQKIITGCGTETNSKIIEVKKPPTVSLDPIDDACDNLNINPVATLENCTSNAAGIVYNWTFVGGNPSSANSLDPGNIVYNSPGTYEITLQITNDCGGSNVASQTFEVFQKPTITNEDLTQQICSNESTSVINLISDIANTTYTWTAAASNGISGFITSGNTNTIPSQTLINSQNGSGTVTYTVIPAVNGCVGDVVDFIITVNSTPRFTTQPVSSEVCQNTPATLLEVAFENGTGTASYEWFVNINSAHTWGNRILGATNPTFDPPTNTVGELHYYAEISFTSGGCSKIVSAVATVNVVEQIVVNPVATAQTICVGGTANEFEVTYSGGTGNPSYQWFSNDSNTNTGGTAIPSAITNTYAPSAFSTSGNFYYYAEVSLNKTGCAPVASDFFEINVVSELIIDTQPMASLAFCKEASPVDLSVSVSGGTSSPKNYQWYQNSGGTITMVGNNSNKYTPDTKNVGTLSYYVVITQPESGCEVTSEISQVVINEGPSITNQPISSELCLGGTGNLLEVDFTDGTGTVTYQWFSNTDNVNSGGTLINGATANTFGPPVNTLGTIFYYAEISFSAGGCSKIVSDTASVLIAEQLTVNNITTEQTICEGGTANELQVSTSGGAGIAGYQWFSNSVNSNTGGTLINGGTTNSYNPPTFSSEGSFYFYAIISLGGNACNTATSDVFQIDVLPSPVIDVQPIASQIVCQYSTSSGIADLFVTVFGVSTINKTYQWFSNTIDANSGGTLINGAKANQYNPPIDILGTIFYYVEVSFSSGGCSKIVSNTASVEVIDIVYPQDIDTSPKTYCVGEISDPIEVVYPDQNGLELYYQWYSNTEDDVFDNRETTIDGEITNSYTPPTNVAGTLYYFVTIKNSVCPTQYTISDTFKVTVNETPVIANAAISIYSEETFSFNPTLVAGNTIPNNTLYTWSAPSFTPTGSIIGASAETNSQEFISQILENTTATPIKVTYTVTPTTTSCSGNAFILEITVNPSITPNAVALNNSCFEANDGAITTNITGGIPFDAGNPYITSWVGPNGFSSSDASISNLETGIYTLTVEDKNGITTTEEFVITQPDALAITKDVAKNISCFNGNDGMIEVTITGGTLAYTYNWTTTNGSGIVPNQKNQNTLTKGNYTLEVIDKNNCTISTNFILTEPEEIKIGLINKNDILCFGDATGSLEVDVSGGTKTEISAGVFDYVYNWSGPNGYANTSKNIDNLFTGTYTLSVIDDLGCATNTSFIINQLDQINIDVIKTDESCYQKNDGSIDVTLTGGTTPYTFSWSNSATDLSLSNLVPDSYTITVTDANNCTEQVSIVINDAIFYIEPTTTPIKCNSENDASISLNLTGGIDPISIVWSDGATGVGQRSNLAAGTYTVTITDSNATQCPIEETFIVSNPPQIIVTETVIDATDCNEENSGSINLKVSGGVAPFSFLWNTNETSEDLKNIGEGDYSVQITDANGCVVIKQFNIFRPKPIDITFDEILLKDCDLKTTSKQITATVTDGVLPYTYTWSSGAISGLDNNIMTISQSGEYSLTVKDARGCEAIKTFYIDVPSIGIQDFNFTSFAFDNYNLFSIQDPIQFTNSSPGDYSKVTWDFGDGNGISNEENPVYTYDKIGFFTITYTVEYEAGCTYVLERDVNITKGYVLINPNAFTPNGDGYNENMKPIHKSFSEIEMTIYNSWGAIVYYEKSLNFNGWNGLINGLPVENGNYVMVVKGLTFYKGLIIETTPFTLIK